MKISVALATFNEEENLSRCLESVKFAEEIVIVDGSSTDRTVEIANKFGARVEVTDNPPIFHINKQKAIDKCRGDWILQLDADEVVSPELSEEIKKIVTFSADDLNQRQLKSQDADLFLRHQKLVEERDGKIGKASGDISAFFIPRKNYFLGSFLRYGGLYPDGVIRLVRKGKARFPCKSVHEQIEINGRVSWLENSLLHFDSPTFSRYLTRSNKYTSLTATEFKEKNLNLNILTTMIYIIVVPLRVFFNLYFRHKGFKDGFPGLVFALFSGLHFPIAYIKYREMKK